MILILIHVFDLVEEFGGVLFLLVKLIITAYMLYCSASQVSSYY